MDCSMPGSSVHRTSQARILEWVAISSPRGSSWPKGGTLVFCIAGRFFTIWATREAHGLSTGTVLTVNLYSPVATGLDVGDEGSKTSFFKIYLFFNWRIVALQNFVVFCQTVIWISHRNTRHLRLEPPSHWYKDPVWVPWDIQLIPIGYVFYYMIM